MKPSATYLQFKAMIEKDWVITNTTEIIRKLQLIEEQGMITEEEYKSLLDPIS